jgi:hypothetical protein
VLWDQASVGVALLIIKLRPHVLYMPLPVLILKAIFFSGWYCNPSTQVAYHPFAAQSCEAHGVSMWGGEWYNESGVLLSVALPESLVQRATQSMWALKEHSELKITGSCSPLS